MEILQYAFNFCMGLICVLMVLMAHNDRLYHEGYLDRNIRQRAVQEIEGVV